MYLRIHTQTNVRANCANRALTVSYMAFDANAKRKPAVARIINKAGIHILLKLSDE